MGFGRGFSTTTGFLAATTLTGAAERLAWRDSAPLRGFAADFTFSGLEALRAFG
jgi:hypothetical protein